MNNKPVTVAGLLIAIAVIVAGLALYFSLHHCAPAPSHGGGCCCCGGSGSNGGGQNGGGASGPGKFGNPSTTITTGAGVMNGLPIPASSLSSAPYDGLVHIHIDPSTANPPGSPISFTINYTSTGPALTMMQGNTMVQPVQVNTSRTITYTGLDTVSYTIGWPNSTLGSATLTSNYPPTGYPGGASDYSGTYSFSGGVGNLTIH